MYRDATNVSFNERKQDCFDVCRETDATRKTGSVNRTKYIVHKDVNFSGECCAEAADQAVRDTNQQFQRRHSPSRRFA